MRAVGALSVELYSEPCCGLCLFLNSLATPGHFPVFPDQQVWARNHAPCGGASKTAEFNVAFGCLNVVKFSVYSIRKRTQDAGWSLN